MNMWIIATALLCGTAEPEDGSLVFLQNSNRLVETYTRSEISHVGIVLHSEGRCWVYEATPAQVRRVPLADYYQEMGGYNERRSRQMQVWLLRPQKAYSSQQIAAMKTYLDAQLGRRYSIKGYVRERPVDGIHCSELMAAAIAKTGRIDFDNFHGVNPGELWERVQPLHQAPREVTVQAKPSQGSWCERSRNWWNSFSTWCQWSCYESWTFCR